MSKKPGNSYTYREAGVDIDAGARLVEAIKPLAASTARSGADADLGGFGGFFDLQATGYKDPLLVAANDGVGTKLKIAIAAGRHDTVGIDLVAMCVNDLVVQGAEPLFFLDYYGTGRLDVEAATAVVSGIAEGCRQAGCALIGGESAEMPGIYDGEDYDLVGFSVGAVERDRVLDGSGMKPGDVVLGLASSGLHSNGFSLVRRLADDLGPGYDAPAPFATPDADSQTLAEALLTPTRIYVRSCLAAHRAGQVKALAHITGGGLPENLPRVLPQGLGVEIDLGAWALPPVFAWLADLGGLEQDELLRTFNCGIGMAVVLGEDHAEAAAKTFQEAGETVHVIGRVVEATDRQVIFGGSLKSG